MELEKKIDSLQQSKQILKNKKSGPKPTEQDGSNNPSASTSLSQANGLSASPSLDGPLAGLRDGRAGDPLAGLRDREAGDPLAELRDREVGDPLAELRDREAGDPLAELRDREMGDPLAELRDREAGDPLAELRDREVGDPLAELRDREAGDPLSELRDGEADDPLAELWDRQAGGGSPAKGPSPVPAMAKKRKRVSPVPAVAERRKRLTTPHNNAPQKGNVWEYGTYPPEPLKTDQYIAVAFKDTYYVGKVTSVHGKTAEIKYLAYNGCGMYSPTKKAPDKTKDKYVLAVDLSFKQMTEGKIVVHSQDREELNKQWKWHILAVLHFNENLKRQVHNTKDGRAYYRVTYPKYKLGEEVVKKVAAPPPTYKEQLKETRDKYSKKVPKPLFSQFTDRRSRQEAIVQEEQSRMKV
ncbi:Hypp6543 [Branchiostoma lanceolatum]|uniref:Hypp6543 protein n=1 Tax=Branchiostoma lanceolatum TaxID=7740 RepID=A0A8J9YV69_BRALA|nr:Hypp6543 [Branchiostoma lanceolatum]